MKSCGEVYGVRLPREACERDVEVLPPAEVEAIIRSGGSGGFDAPVPFFQAGLIHARYSKRAATRREA